MASFSSGSFSTASFSVISFSFGDVEYQPPVYIGGSFAYRPEPKPKERKNIEEDEILMLFM